MTIYSGFSHWKWWFSIVMLVYQRVFSESSRRMDPCWQKTQKNPGGDESNDGRSAPMALQFPVQGESKHWEIMIPCHGSRRMSWSPQGTNMHQYYHYYPILMYTTYKHQQIIPLDPFASSSSISKPLSAARSKRSTSSSTDSTAPAAEPRGGNSICWGLRSWVFGEL